jgi:hypothetical protein
MEHEASLIVVDFKDNMETSIIKWKCILTIIMTNGQFKHFRYETICKDKWGSSNGDCKKINNFKDVTNHNEDY